MKQWLPAPATLEVEVARTAISKFGGGCSGHSAPFLGWPTSYLVSKRNMDILSY